MKTYLLIALFGLMFLGCAKKKDPTPTIDLVGTWELVTFTVTPAPVNGVSDYLAYLRQIFGYNCSEIHFYYNFKADKTFTETTQSTCQSSGNTTDTLLDGTWSLDQTTLSLTTDDGSGTLQTQQYNVEAQPATASQHASLTFTFTDNGTSYFIKLSKS